MSKHVKAASSGDSPAGAGKPIGAWMSPPAASQNTAHELIEELRHSIAALETEVDAMASMAHAASGAPSGIQAKDLVAVKRDELERLNARLEEIELLLTEG